MKMLIILFKSLVRPVRTKLDWTEPKFCLPDRGKGFLLSNHLGAAVNIDHGI